MMNAKMQFKFLTVILTIVLTQGLAACAYRGGPPIYTAAHHHHPYHYYYYPSTRVYFHLSTGNYWHRSDGHWRRARVLPPHIYLDRRDRVRVWEDIDKPHLRHERHARQYKPRQNYNPDRDRDHRERSHNTRRHEEYRRK